MIGNAVGTKRERSGATFPRLMPGTYTFLEALDDAIGDGLIDVVVCFHSEFRLDDKGARDYRALDLLALHHRRFTWNQGGTHRQILVARGSL